MPQIHLNLDRNLIFGERKKYVFTCIVHIYYAEQKWSVLSSLSLGSRKTEIETEKYGNHAMCGNMHCSLLLHCILSCIIYITSACMHFMCAQFNRDIARWSLFVVTLVISQNNVWPHIACVNERQTGRTHTPPSVISIHHHMSSGLQAKTWPQARVNATIDRNCCLTAATA